MRVSWFRGCWVLLAVFVLVTQSGCTSSGGTSTSNGSSDIVRGKGKQPTRVHRGDRPDEGPQGGKKVLLP